MKRIEKAKFTWKKDKRDGLEKVIDSLTEKMLDTDVESEEYAKMATSLEKLYSAKGKDKTKKFLDKIPDAVIVGIFGLVQIGAILGSEKIFNNVITSKAMGYVMRGRV